jgi:hypothetical protein
VRQHGRLSASSEIQPVTHIVRDALAETVGLRCVVQMPITSRKTGSPLGSCRWSNTERRTGTAILACR